MKYIASPGTAVIAELKKTSSNDFAKPQSKSKHMATGTIISMGKDVTIEGGAILKASDYGKVGDIVTVLSYYEEGEYDRQEVDGTILYFVRFQDFRSQLKEEDA